MTFIGLVLASCTLTIVAKGLDWYESRGICYTMPPAPCSRTNCTASCARHLAYIAEPVTVPDMEFVSSGLLNGRNGRFLMGITYDDNTGELYLANKVTYDYTHITFRTTVSESLFSYNLGYRWINNGTPPNANFWHDNKPRGPRECVYLDSGKVDWQYSYKLRLGNCDDNNFVICQKLGVRSETIQGPTYVRSFHVCPYPSVYSSTDDNCKNLCRINFVRCIGYKFRNHQCTVYSHKSQCAETAHYLDVIIGMRFYTC